MHASAIDSLTRHTASALITVYQRRVSPHKGFSCAHRILYSSESCSQFVKRTILETGLTGAIPIVRDRFAACKTAQQILQARQQLRLAIGELPEGTNEEEPLEEPPEVQPRKRVGSFRRPPATGTASGVEPNRVGAACDTIDCGCDTIDCASVSCDGLDASSISCESLDCGGADCSSCDVGSLDCGSCDVGSCGG